MGEGGVKNLKKMPTLLMDGSIWHLFLSHIELSDKSLESTLN